MLDLGCVVVCVLSCVQLVVSPILGCNGGHLDWVSLAMSASQRRGGSRWEVGCGTAEARGPLRGPRWRPQHGVSGPAGRPSSSSTHHGRRAPGPGTAVGLRSLPSAQLQAELLSVLTQMGPGQWRACC